MFFNFLFLFWGRKCHRIFVENISPPIFPLLGKKSGSFISPTARTRQCMYGRIHLSRDILLHKCIPPVFQWKEIHCESTLKKYPTTWPSPYFPHSSTIKVSESLVFRRCQSNLADLFQKLSKCHLSKVARDNKLISACKRFIRDAPGSEAINNWTEIIALQVLAGNNYFSIIMIFCRRQSCLSLLTGAIIGCCLIAFVNQFLHLL